MAKGDPLGDDHNDRFVNPRSYPMVSTTPAICNWGIGRTHGFFKDFKVHVKIP